MDNPRIVVLGGGTGSFVVLSALKKHTRNLTAIVNMSDDGGSTGILRDELGILPPGDIRQCLVALARSPKLRDLFTYRAAKGPVHGHAFGNLFLAALEDMTGSFKDALATASEVLNITGSIQPVTYTPVNLVLKDGNTTVFGQDKINRYTLKHPRPSVHLTPSPIPNPAALTAIKQADLIVAAPGDLYHSLAPIIIVPEIASAIAKARAKTVYIANLINKPTHTKGYSIDTYASELERLAGTNFIDCIIYNTHTLSPELLEIYAHDGELPVETKVVNSRYQLIGAPLLAKRPTKRPDSTDALAYMRTLIRHSPSQLGKAIMGML